MSKQYIVDKKSIHLSIFCCLSNLSSGTLNCCQASRMTDSSQCVLDLPWDLLQVGYAKSPYLKETQKVPLSDAKTTSTGFFRYGAVWAPHDHTPCLTSKAQPKHPTLGRPILLLAFMISFIQSLRKACGKLRAFMLDSLFTTTGSFRWHHTNLFVSLFLYSPPTLEQDPK